MFTKTYVIYFVGDLNTIALIISNFFLMAYTLINFSCFAVSFTKSPGKTTLREMDNSYSSSFPQISPSFKFYSHWVALFAAAVCLAIIFVISWWAALITLVAAEALYLLVYWRKPGI